MVGGVTDVLYYATTDRITPRAMEILKRARGIAYGEQEIDFVESQPGVGSLNFGHHGLPDGSIRTLGMREMPETPNAEYIVAAAMRSYADRLEYRAPTTSDVLWLDTEADGVEHRWSMPTEKYVRLGQYAWDQDEEVQFVYSAAEVRDLIESAAVVVPHNGHNFDLSVVYGKDSIRPLELALENRIFDPFVAVGMLFPSPTTYVDRKGRLHKSAALPESREGQQDLGWFGLDNLAFQFGLTGKDGDLKALAEEFGGFGAIPLDDPRYLAYARQDVLTLREVTSAVLQFVELDSYDWREQQIAAVMAQISRNGFRVDERAAKHRNATLAQRREELLTRLKETYGFPSEGKMPWRTTAGKKAVLDFLASVDVNPNEDEDWPRTKTGNISLGGDAIIEGTKGTPAEEDARSIAELMGQRSLAQLTLDCLQPDGRVHPEINSLQRSGRTSVTRPGLTVFNGPEKAYYVPSEGCSLVSVDYSGADGRAVAAMSGDEEYAKRFEPGVKVHELTGRAAFGNEVYDSDPVKYYAMSKPLTHGSNYRMGPAKLAKTLKIALEDARTMMTNYNAAYAKVAAWQERVFQEGNSGWVTNAWGRRMPVERGRSYTQSPGLLGQSTTREIMCDALLRIARHNIEWIRFIKVPVHDELILDIPDDQLDEVLPALPGLMQGTLNGIDFPVAVGAPAKDWRAATHA